MMSGREWMGGFLFKKIVFCILEKTSFALYLHFHFTAASSKIPTLSASTLFLQKRVSAVGVLQPATYVYAMIKARAAAHH